MASLRRGVLGALVLAGLGGSVLAGEEPVAVLELTGVIDQVNAAYIEEGITAAEEAGAVAVLIEVDSPGGELTSTDRIEKAILNSPIPVITWVTPPGAQAASAATFITLAGDVAAMAPLTTIGSASVVGSGGEELPPTIAAKITNDLVANIRGLAESHGRNADWAESAVRDAANLGAEDAVELEPPVVDILAETTDELFAAIDIGERADGYAYHFNGEPLPPLSGRPLMPIGMNFGQEFLHLLSDPNIAFLLFTVGFYGILAELYHPNFFSGIVGGIAIVLAFIGSNSLPLNVAGLVLIAIGLGLFALELFVTSYGLMTVAGIIAFVLGAFALYTGVDGTDAIQIELNPVLVGLPIVLAVGFIALVARGVVEMRRRQSPTQPMLALVGSAGTATTPIAPTGIASAQGETWTARSRHGVIPPGAALRVVGVDGLELIVEPASGQSDRPVEEE
ncbi:MAG TPA: nodulation protein NfeD [Candidatus Limnocylindria bacterium]|nr:nodulation protein NfeD [Candidatus Limnocylindria bacterium]